MTACRLLAPLATLALCTAAPADEITHETSLPPTLLPYNTPLHLPQFDPSLGELQRVRLRISTLLQAVAGIENTSPTSGTAFVDLSSGCTFQQPDTAQAVIFVRPTERVSVLAAPYDGTTDFAGTSGAVLNGLSGTAGDEIDLVGNGLAAFLGTGEVELHFSAEPIVSLPLGDVTVVAPARGWVGFDVELIYDFLPFPDCDGDGVPDVLEPDSDGDGLPDDCDEDPVVEPAHGRAGSLLVFPEFDNRQGMQTLLTVTNTAPTAGSIQVQFHWVPGDTCIDFNDFSVLTDNDTLTVLSSVVAAPVTGRGYVYAYARNLQFEPIVHDALIGSVMKIDGLEAFEWSTPAVAFQGVGAPGSPTDLDLDGIRDLDGTEYVPAPDELHFPRFLGATSQISSELVLINLTGGTAFTATTSFLVYNDNEEAFSAQSVFSCWTATLLTDVSPVFSNSFLSNLTAHDPNEIAGAGGQESGWFRVDGLVATSETTVIQDPALLGLLVERSGTSSAATLPFAFGTQANGDLLPTGVDGDL